MKELLGSRLRSGSVAQAKLPKATESRRGWAAALLRGRAPDVTGLPRGVAGLRGCGEASGAGPSCYSTMSFLRLWTNATTSRCSPSGTWNFANVAAA